MADDEVVVDRRFELPPYVIDARSQDESDGAGYYDTFAPLTEPFEDDEAAWSDPLVAPATFSVLSQTVRSSAGQFVVDVVVEVPDQQGITDYEVRVAKA